MLQELFAMRTKTYFITLTLCMLVAVFSPIVMVALSSTDTASTFIDLGDEEQEETQKDNTEKDAFKAESFSYYTNGNVLSVPTLQPNGLSLSTKSNEIVLPPPETTSI